MFYASWKKQQTHIVASQREVSSLALSSQRCSTVIEAGIMDTLEDCLTMHGYVPAINVLIMVGIQGLAVCFIVCAAHMRCVNWLIYQRVCLIADVITIATCVSYLVFVGYHPVDHHDM